MAADVFADERVAGLSPVAFRLWVMLRAWACRVESGGVVLAPDVSHGDVRWTPFTAKPGPDAGYLGATYGVSGEWVWPRMPDKRVVSQLTDVGLLVPVSDGSGCLALCDAAVWRERESRMSAGRDAARARRVSRVSGVSASRDGVSRRGGGVVGDRDIRRVAALEVERENEVNSLSTDPSKANSRTAREPRTDGMRRVDLAPHLQQPDTDGLRPYVRQALITARNIRDPRILEDLAADGDLTPTEHDAITRALETRNPEPHHNTPPH